MNKKVFSGVMAVITAISLYPIVSFADAAADNGYLTPDVGNVADADYANQADKSIIAFFTNDNEASEPEEVADIVVFDMGENIRESYPIDIPEAHKDYIVIIFGGNEQKNARTVVTLPHVTHWYPNEWSGDETYHWKECGNGGCDEITEKAEHINGEDDSICTTPICCTVCEDPVVPGAESHIYTDAYDVSCNAVGCTYERTTSAVTVTFNVNGGAALGTNQITTRADGKISTTLPIPIRNGWSFNGWYTSATGGTKIEQNSTVFYDNTTLYAQWTHITVGSGSVSTGGGGGGSSFLGSSAYTLTFNTNGGTAINAYTGIKDLTVHLGDFATSKEGSSFAGWYSDAALTKEVSTVKLTGNITVYAKWDEGTENNEPSADTGTGFSDVSSDDWYSEAVEYVAEKGIMNGVSETEFAPHSTTTRAMLVTMLYRLEGEPEIASIVQREGDRDSGGEIVKSTFSDVQPEAYYEKAVIWAKENGIVNGYENGSFGTDDAVSREQLASILYRYAAYKEYDTNYEDTNILSFDDAFEASEYAYTALQWACKNGIITGDGNKLMPDASAERCQVAAMLMRFCTTNVKD